MRRARGAERCAVEAQLVAGLGAARGEEHALVRARDVGIERQDRAVGRRDDARRHARSVGERDPARLRAGEEPLAARRLDGGEKATCSATTPGGGSGGGRAPSASRAERIASQAGAAPETPETPRIESPSKFPTQTPTA